MKIPAAFTTVTLFSKICALIVFFVSLIIAFHLGRIYQEQQDMQKIPQDAGPNIQSLNQPTPSPTAYVMPTAPQVTYTISDGNSNWQIYDKDFGGRVHFKFKYPPQYVVHDEDWSSGSVYVYDTKNNINILTLDTVQWMFMFDEAYTGGSRRVWFTNMMKKYQPTHYEDGMEKPSDYSTLKFTDKILPNGTQLLQVSNFPGSTSSQSKERDTNMYIGVQNGIMFYAESPFSESKTADEILATLEVSSPRN